MGEVFYRVVGVFGVAGVQPGLLLEQAFNLGLRDAALLESVCYVSGVSELAEEVLELCLFSLVYFRDGGGDG